MIGQAYFRSQTFKAQPNRSPLVHTPALIYDLEVFKKRFLVLKQLEGDLNCKFHSAIKAFPHAKVQEIALQYGLGFDVSNYNEYAFLMAIARNLDWGHPIDVSITGPFLSEIAQTLSNVQERRHQHHSHSSSATRINVDSLTQYLSLKDELPEWVEIGTRILWEIDPGKRQSTRFGICTSDTEVFREIARDRRFSGFHAHISHKEKHDQSYVQCAESIVNLASQIGCAYKYINFGGSFHRESPAEITNLVLQLRRVIPSDVTIAFEPGKYWAKGAGSAITKVLDIKRMSRREGYWIVLDISKDCHLRWCKPIFNLPIDLSQSRRSVPAVFTGPTCHEGDILGAVELPLLESGELPISLGAVLRLTNI